jgi:hypothetical protein
MTRYLGFPRPSIRPHTPSSRPFDRTPSALPRPIGRLGLRIAVLRIASVKADTVSCRPFPLFPVGRNHGHRALSVGWRSVPWEFYVCRSRDLGAGRQSERAPAALQGRKWLSGPPH